MVLPDIWMMHLDSRLISRELKGRTRTATLTDAPAIAPAGGGAAIGERRLSCGGESRGLGELASEPPQMEKWAKG